MCIDVRVFVCLFVCMFVCLNLLFFLFKKERGVKRNFNGFKDNDNKKREEKNVHSVRTVYHPPSQVSLVQQLRSNTYFCSIL